MKEWEENQHQLNAIRLPANFEERFEAAKQIANLTKRLAALEQLRQQVFAEFQSDEARALLGRNDFGPLPVAIAQTRNAIRERKISNDWLVTGERHDAQPNQCIQVRNAPEKGRLIIAERDDQEEKEVLKKVKALGHGGWIRF